jgi:capsular polysaccharide biosynthesis protein
MSIKRIIFKVTPKFVNTLLKKVRSKSYSIVLNPDETFEKIYMVKDVSWEDSYYPECFEHCKEQHLKVYIPAEYIYKEPNGIVSAESDVVITDKGAYWEKFNKEEFVTWAEPADFNVFGYDNNNIRIRRYKVQEFIPGRTLSLLGVWAFHWGHCMYQFLPKLFSAGEAGLLDNPITVLIVENEDSTIMELVNYYLAKFPNAKIKFAKNKVDYTCEELYFMPSPGSSFNNCKFRLDYPYYISAHVLEKTQRYVINPIIKIVKNNKPKYDKIFLPRGFHRTLTNYQEVHDYFLSLGYVDIEGSSLTWEEKADIFYHAKEVVGLYGTALLNLMFCNQAKCMVLVNYKMSTDTSLYLQIRDHVSNLVNVTGQDESADYHSNYYIPLEKIKRAYKEYIEI